jgi:hypothetical protein
MELRKTAKMWRIVTHTETVAVQVGITFPNQFPGIFSLVDVIDVSLALLFPGCI